MLTLTSPFETRFHRLPASVKLAALAVATLVIMPQTKPVAILLAAAVAAALYLSEGLKFSAHGMRMLKPLWPFLAVLVLWHGFSGDWALGEIWAGAALGIKMLTAVALANLVTMTTRLDEMIGVFERIARPLERFGLSPQVLAVSIALVIRFVPVLMQRTNQLAESWRARSGRRPNWRIVAPVALAAIDEAEQIAEALRARGGI